MSKEHSASRTYYIIFFSLNFSYIIDREITFFFCIFTPNNINVKTTNLKHCNISIYLVLLAAELTVKTPSAGAVTGATVVGYFGDRVAELDCGCCCCGCCCCCCVCCCCCCCCCGCCAPGGLREIAIPEMCSVGDLKATSTMGSDSPPASKELKEKVIKKDNVVCSGC